MATFFGEILPVISRAVEDDDDITPITRNLEFVWKNESVETELKVDSLIVAVGDVASCFLEAHYALDDSNLVGIMKQEKDSDDADDGFEAISRPEDAVSTCYLLRSKERTVAITTCKCYVAPEQIWPWTEKFFKCVKPSTDVVVLTSSTIHELRCENPDNFLMPVMRALTTSKKPEHHPLFPTLEQPNMLKNIPAAVITYCEVHHIPAVVYVCYAETFHLQLEAVKAFTPFLDSPQFPAVTNKEYSTKKMLQAIKNHVSGQSLYI